MVADDQTTARPGVDLTRYGGAQTMRDAHAAFGQVSNRPPLPGRQTLAGMLDELDAGDDQARADADHIRQVAADALTAAMKAEGPVAAAAELPSDLAHRVVLMIEALAEVHWTIEQLMPAIVPLLDELRAEVADHERDDDFLWGFDEASGGHLVLNLVAAIGAACTAVGSVGDTKTTDEIAVAVRAVTVDGPLAQAVRS